MELTNFLPILFLIYYILIRSLRVSPLFELCVNLIIFVSTMMIDPSLGISSTFSLFPMFLIATYINRSSISYDLRSSLDIIAFLVLMATNIFQLLFTFLLLISCLITLGEKSQFRSFLSRESIILNVVLMMMTSLFVLLSYVSDHVLVGVFSLFFLLLIVSKISYLVLFNRLNDVGYLKVLLLFFILKLLEILDAIYLNHHFELGVVAIFMSVMFVYVMMIANTDRANLLQELIVFSTILFFMITAIVNRDFYSSLMIILTLTYYIGIKFLAHMQKKVVSNSYKEFFLFMSSFGFSPLILYKFYFLNGDEVYRAGLMVLAIIPVVFGAYYLNERKTIQGSVSNR